MEREKSSKVELRQALDQVLERERSFANLLQAAPQGLPESPAMEAVLLRLRVAASQHCEGLESRRRYHFGKEPGAATQTDPSDVHRSDALPSASRFAMTIFGRLNEILLGHVILHATAHRFFDGIPEGSTAHLAERCLREYVGLADEMVLAVSELAVRELGREGQECLCQCPACGVGICLCSPHGTVTVVEALRESRTAAPPGGPKGIEVRPPWAGSPAERAGLQPGDVLIAVDGKPLPDETSGSIGVLQEAIHGHSPGEPVRLTVERVGAGTKEFVLVR